MIAQIDISQLGSDPKTWLVVIGGLLLSLIVGRFVQAFRSGEGILGSAKAVWLGTNTPRSADGPRPQRPTSDDAAASRDGSRSEDVPPFRPPVWIIAFAVLSLGLGACMTVNKATVTLTSVVDAGMKDWAQASYQGRTTAELDAKVVAAHNEYRKVCAAIVPIYEAAIAKGENPDAAAVLGTLRAAIDPLMDLLLPVLLPAEQANLKTQLGKVNAP